MAPGYNSLEMIAVVLLAAGCGSPAPPNTLGLAPPTPNLTGLSAPWTVRHSDATTVTLQHGDTPDGVRIWLGDDGSGTVPGVTIVHGGRALEAPHDGGRWPLVAVAYPEREVSAATVEVDGPDLVVRLAGPPLRAVTDHPDAPDDPVLTWVRLRPRGSSWRVVLDGLGTVTLAGAEGVVPTEEGVAIDTAHGAFSLQSSAGRSASTLFGETWMWSSVPALDAVDPYPRTALTFSP